MTEELMEIQLFNQYMFDVQELQKVREDYKQYIFKSYSEKYPYRLISRYFLSRTMNDLEACSLIPEKTQYIESHRNCEIFPLPLVYHIGIQAQLIRLNIPMIINISSLSRSLEKRKASTKLMPVEILARYITDIYWETYETDLQIEINRSDGASAEKAKNPIIVLQESDVNEYVILNGNHRVMWMSKENIKENVEVFFVSLEECLPHSVGKDWNIIFKDLKRMNKWVKGSEPGYYKKYKNPIGI